MPYRFKLEYPIQLVMLKPGVSPPAHDPIRIHHIADVQGLVTRWGEGAVVG